MGNDQEQHADTESGLDSPLPFVLPLVVLLAAPSAVGLLIPESAPESRALAAGSSPFDGQAFFAALAQLTLVGIVLWWFRGIYLRAFPPRFSFWSIPLGIVGVVLWVLLCSPQWEAQLLQSVGLKGLLPERPGVNPFESFGPQSVVWFLTIRFLVLAMIVPLAEELFVRAWLVRYFQAQENWDLQSLKGVGWTAQLGVLAYAVLTHPQEAIAAIAWFGMVNWWMKRTGSLWDCVVVHAVTNGLLGAWILYSGQWRLW